MSDDLKDLLVVAAALAGTVIAWRAWRSGGELLAEAGEGVSIVGDWMNETVGDVWRDITRGSAQLTDDSQDRNAAIAAEFGANWQDRLDPWDPVLAGQIRAFLRENGYHSADGENGVFQ